MMKKLMIDLARPAGSNTENDITSNGTISVIFSGENHRAGSQSEMPGNISPWKTYEILALQDATVNTADARNALIHEVQKAGGEWLAFVAGTDAAGLKHLAGCAVPAHHFDMLAVIDKTSISENPAPHIARRRPLSALSMMLTGYPVFAAETDFCLIRKKTALALLPSLPNDVPLNAAFGAVLKRMGCEIRYVPARVDPSAGMRFIFDRIKRFATSLQLVFHVYPGRVTIPAALLLCIPGLMGAYRVLSGGGGYVSLFVALFCLLGALVVFLFGHLYDQLVKIRYQRAYYSEGSQASQ